VDCISGAKFLPCDEISRKSRMRESLVAMSTAKGWRSRAAALAAIRHCADSLFIPNLPSVRAYYGISDLVALATETHKFELHYTDWLIEPFRPNSALYYDRSPIQFHR